MSTSFSSDYLYELIQELKEENENLKADISYLEDRVSSVEYDVGGLKEQ